MRRYERVTPGLSIQHGQKKRIGGCQSYPSFFQSSLIDLRAEKDAYIHRAVIWIGKQAIQRTQRLDALHEFTLGFYSRIRLQALCHRKAGDISHEPKRESGTSTARSRPKGLESRAGRIASRRLQRSLFQPPPREIRQFFRVE